MALYGLHHALVVWVLRDCSNTLILPRSVIKSRLLGFDYGVQVKLAFTSLGAEFHKLAMRIWASRSLGFD